MSAIRILPENLANQIAAGEVVERPASVVKELLENAVDAGAGRVTVQVEGNATGLIRVIDDGHGMDGDDLLLSLERHATSKITDQASLAAIRTLGFRGEAMPSIASVSRLRLTSRPTGAELGAMVEVSYGTVRKVSEAGAPVGTTVEIRDLFGNVPARRKFLKSARTELYHVEECIRNCALAFPYLGVDYQLNGRSAWQWPAGVDDLAHRLARLFAGVDATELLRLADGELAEQLLAAARPLEVVERQLAAGDRELPPVVAGLLPLPEAMPATGGKLRILVNGRPVRDRLLGQAVSEALRNELARGRRPAGALFIAIEPALVDVNVHPTKQEIRFRAPAGVQEAVRQAVTAALKAHERQRRDTFFGQPAVADKAAVTPRQPAAAAAEQPLRQEKLPTTMAAPVSAHSAAAPTAFVTGRSAAGAAGESGEESRPPAAPEVDKTGPQLAGQAAALGEDRPLSGEFAEPPAATSPTVSVAEKGADWPAEGEGPVAAPAADPRPRLVGQVLRSYIFCESGGALLAIDQHAAHERLLFEKLRRQYQQQGLARQGLLFPAVLELSPAEAAVLERRGEEIARLGLEVAEFGGHSYLVKAVPALLAGAAPAEIVAGVLAPWLAEGGRSGAATLEEVLAQMACKAAIKAGQHLEAAEMESLLAEMQQAGLFSRCPHGRPVVRRLEPHELEKWFHR
ncbi:MAG: DNA mismatch repair endonuclease MutL [Desulfurivibrio sp.]|nr:DNA mismatch repair endonuclease MutL [Desulfurivibrio sp.]